MTNILITAIFDKDFNKAQEIIIANEADIVNQLSKDTDIHPLFTAIDFSLHPDLPSLTQQDKLKFIKLAVLMLEHGANPKIIDKTGATPLHYAVRADSLKLVILLITKGVDCNSQDCSGETALHRAVQCGSEVIVDYLLSLKDLDISSYTVFDYAIKYHPELVPILFLKFERTAKSHVMLGFYHEKKFEIFHALNSYREALKLDPDDLSALHNLRGLLITIADDISDHHMMVKSKLLTEAADYLARAKTISEASVTLKLS